jgi:hypothetical protein
MPATYPALTTGSICHSAYIFSEDRSDFNINMLIRPTLEKIVAAAITP